MKIEVAIKKPGKPAQRALIEDSLESLQHYVGGYIEIVTLCSDLVIICDEEGRLKGKEHNCTVCGYDFVGTIILAGKKDDEITGLPVKWSEILKGIPTLKV